NLPAVNFVILCTLGLSRLTEQVILNKHISQSGPNCFEVDCMHRLELPRNFEPAVINRGEFDRTGVDDPIRYIINLSLSVDTSMYSSEGSSVICNGVKLTWSSP